MRLRFTDSRAQSISLELLHDLNTDTQACEFQSSDSYWKIGLTMADLAATREMLIAQGITVTELKQFRDIGYLCHLHDPDGFAIELLCHRFETSADTQSKHLPPLNLGQVTLRIANIEACLDFYQSVLGMKLLSRQAVEPHGFTLYFLASTTQTPPLSDIDSVGNREWLWQRPYTSLELQHVWGEAARRDEYTKHADGTAGFWGIGFDADAPESLIAPWAQRALEPVLTKDAHDGTCLTGMDPDGNRVKVVRRR